MRTVVAPLLVAAALTLAAPAAAKSSSEVSLGLRSSEQVPPGARLNLRPRPSDPRGLYVGPVFVEGPLAATLSRLPPKLRRVLASRVGPTPLTFDTGAASGFSLGLGLYLRF